MQGTLFIGCFYLVFHEVEVIATVTYSSFIVFFHKLESLQARPFISEQLKILFESGKK